MVRGEQGAPMIGQQAAEELWRATLAEVKAQVCRQPQRDDQEAAPGGWVAVEGAAAGFDSTNEWSDTWPQQQWHIAFEILFCQAPLSIAALRPHQDDLLLFAYFADVAASRPTPVFARRRGTSLPEDLRWGVGAHCAEVDWRASLLLNIVLQTQYLLTMACCARWDLEGNGATVTVSGADSSGGGRQEASSGIDAIHSSRKRIVKVVHASPSRVPVNLDQTKARSAEPKASFPDICFAVDDFAESHDSLVLAQPEDCYCVLLHADVGSSWREAAAPPALPAVPPAGSTRGIGAAANALGELQRRASGGPGIDQLDVLLFSGYVSHSQLSVALGSRLHNPLRVLRGEQADTSRVQLRGPGGVGSAEVAVTALSERDGSDWPAVPEGSAPETSSAGSRGGSSLPKLLRRAAEAAKSVLAAPAATAERVGGGRERLRCALITLGVPVDALAQDILQAL